MKGGTDVQKNDRTSSTSLWIRVIALILVIALTAGIVVYAISSLF